jgi:hypothetical protein
LDARKLRKSTEFIDDDAFPGIWWFFNEWLCIGGRDDWKGIYVNFLLEILSI